MQGQAIFDERPTRQASVAQGLFLGKSGRRAVAQTRDKEGFKPEGTAPRGSKMPVKAHLDRGHARPREIGIKAEIYAKKGKLSR